MTVGVTTHEAPVRGTGGSTGAVQQRAVGRVVHQLMHLFGGRPVDLEELERQAHVILSMPRVRDVGAGEEEVRTAVALYSRLVSHPDVAQLVDQECLFEVPFSQVDTNSTQQRPGSASTIWRGAIDCLVRRPDGTMRVLEFKTGSPRPEHQRQLDWYVAAVRVMFPKAEVDGRLIYP